MQKLVEVLNYYYVIDNKLKIEKGWAYDKEVKYITFITNAHLHSIAMSGNYIYEMIIATNNSSLLLPQIANTDLSKLIDKEVRCKFTVVEKEGAIAYSSNTDKAYKECQRLLKAYPNMLCKVDIKTT